jgi:uncharacterized protein
MVLAAGALIVLALIFGPSLWVKIVMRYALVDMIHANTKVAIKMLRHEKQFWKLSTFKSMFKFFFSKKGALRSNYAGYKLFFDKDFNPQAHGTDLDLTPWKVKFS